MERSTVSVSIRGRVQGVGFRAWVQHRAELQGLDGWVRNRRDGSVEALFAGARDDVETMLQACRRGPAGARVDEVVVEEAAEAAPARPGRFEVLATG